MRVLLDCKMRLKQSYCFPTRSKGPALSPLRPASWTRSSFQQASVEKLNLLSIEFNELRTVDTAEVISSDAVQVTVRVIRTDEELMIARSVWRLERTVLERKAQPRAGLAIAGASA